MKLIRIVLVAVTLLACLGLATVGAHAQYRAAVQGSILDPQGAVVQGATVTLINNETDISKTATSDAAGVFNFTGLAPARYTLTVEKAGFKKRVVENVQVLGEQANAVNVSLEIGAASTSVTVNAGDLPVIDTETGAISGTLSNKEIQALPSFGRDPYQLVRLAPGVFGDGATGSGGGGTALPGSNQSSSSSTGSIFETENQPQIVAGGTRNNGNSYQIDGIEVNSLAWGGSAVITPNEESVKEVRIEANPYNAENGRNSGAQVLVVSQNGTNQFHGSAFFKLHRPGLDAYQGWGGPYGQPQRDSARFNQYGGSVGGPVLKNKVFFFFSYETLRNNTSSPGGSSWFETPQFLAGVQAAQPNSIAAKFASFPKISPVYSQVNTVTCAQVGLPATQCQTIYSSGGQYMGLDVGSPDGQPLGTADPTYGLANTPYGVGGGLDGIPDIMNVTTISPDKQTATQYNGRMDFNVTKKDLVTFSIYYVPNDNDGFFNGPARGTNIWNSNRLNYSEAVLWDHTFSPSLLNEARFNVTRWYFDELKSNSQEPFGFPADNINGIGQIGFPGPFFGPPGPGIFHQTTYNIRDTVTKIFGSHSLKFGGDIYKEQDDDVAIWAGLPPSYQFNDLWDFANDAPHSESASFDPRTGTPTGVYKYIRSNINAFFLQDEFKVKPNLTITMGLRWEYFGPVHEKNNNLSTVVLGSGDDTVSGASVRVGGNLYNSSYNNWGPQVGFAWSPNSAFGHGFNNKFVLRGGFGIAYNRQQEAITLNGRFNPPLQTSLTLFGSNIEYATSTSPSDIFGFPSNPAAMQTFGSNGLPSCAPVSCAPVNLTAFDQNSPTPMVYRYSLLGQYDIGHHWVATVGYQGSLSRHFTRQINNLNWLYGDNLNPEVQGIDLYTNDANAHYSGLITEIEHQFANTFQIDAQYTFSSCMDHGSQDYYSDPYPFNVKASNGHCDFDVTHAFKAYGIWSPRIFHGANDWREKVLGGWQLSGIFTYHTGFPFSPYYNVDVTGEGCSLIYVNSGFCNVVPAAYTGGAGSSSSNSTFQKQYGNFSQLATNPTAYFTIPTLSATGLPPYPGVQRNLFRGPHYHDTDLTVGKDFGLPSMKILGENAKLAIRANFYNLFNTLNLSPISGPQGLGTLTLDPTTNTVTSFSPYTSFGQSQGALGARVIEFQARFSF